ncbi:MAG: hypothetical protein O2923_08095 [Verrucomicrobia bacterium]|nr:hypothetical protein [Verrucomicrobiota bacterium]MDA1087336.1 hypothetical protein [Verrucomicrobiota bacterium]
MTSLCFGFRELHYGKDWWSIKNEILIGTVRFEKNRWTPGHLPSFIEARIRRRVAMPVEAGFEGIWTAEFTAGVNTPPESIDALLGAATDDLLVLREALAC